MVKNGTAVPGRMVTEQREAGQRIFAAATRFSYHLLPLRF